MSKIIIGKYIRLSQEDRDLGDDKSVSNSILHQRDLIQNYIKNNPELAGYSQQEFFDDGFTGRNFERSAFEELLEKHTRAVAKDKQIIVEGMHEPIISKKLSAKG